MSLKNKVVIVTGAKQGIGFGIAQAFAKEGANVVVSDINHEGSEKAAKKLLKYKVKAIGIGCDVSKKEEVDNLVKETIKKFGKIDILVNNAGIFPFIPFNKMTESDWDKVIDVNLKSIFLCSQAVLKKMKSGSKIVNISSIASLVAFEGLVHYCASKGGVNAMTRALALEYASKNICINAVAPGSITTEGTKTDNVEEASKGIESVIPLKRPGKPDDIAQAVVFLASSKSDYITGQVLTVDGGWVLR